jgi:hypothetical protein
VFEAVESLVAERADLELRLADPATTSTSRRSQ